MVGNRSPRVAGLRSALGGHSAGRFLDLTEPILAEEHFLADEKGRGAEDAALDYRRSVLNELPLDGLALRRGDEARIIELRSVHRRLQNLQIVELQTVL